MSVRNTILDNLTTALAAISGVKVASRDFKEYPCPNNTWYPALFVTDSGGQEPTNYCASNKAQETMLITVVGYYYRPENLSSGFSDFLDLIYDAIYPSISLGSNVRDCTIISVNPIVPVPAENVVLFDLNLEIKYWRSLV